MQALEVSSCQGRLYCFDAYGQIVSKDVSPPDERLGSQQGVLPKAQQALLIRGVYGSRDLAAFPIVF